MELSDDSVPAPTTSVRTPAAEQLTQATPTAKPALDPTPPATADSRTPATGPPSTHPTSPPEKVQALPDVGPVDEPAPAPVVPTEKTELYSIVSQVGEGTFGKVYKATNNVSQHLVALKRIRMETERDGFPVTAMREIKLLQSLKHENVVRLYEMVVSNAHVYMVFEYMDHDLTGVLSQNQFSFSEAHLKSLCYQMLAGLAYLHHKGVIHRDIKGSNILVNNRGELKLADFGLARFYHKRRRADYTNRVITLWYRPPELLLGATVYGPEVDMWSAGCIMLELYTKKPVFQGDDEIHQLDVIYKVLGTPTPERWQGVLNLPWYELVKPKEPMPNHFREIFKKWMSPTALDLAEYLLAYDPAARATATQAMDAQYFKEDPAPELPLSTLEGEWHELETKRERARRKRETRTGTQ
ncbi:kinase-like domain-containing protein [Schizophyllum amplum]|uniref:[RNA-polymerase]-subunit kinase n=1 Tax=Schizophyllum amplum TaxID=97359 RepID=A0A550CSN8_9AGAR|nr:kinase-like domain-containing protein [Auriculariopsis ampla]